MLKRLGIAAAALALMGQGGEITRSPPMVKGTGLPPESDDLPAYAATTPPPGLDPVTDEDRRGTMPAGEHCSFATDRGAVLIAGAERLAFARPGGVATPMFYEGPELRLGGYFTAGDVTIVIEPDSATARAAAGGGTAWTAAAIIDRAGRNARHAGTWQCK
ncbi:hypothetical protein FHS96_001202 [Sphingomonas zeicaulis]|uniref:hypothetical protein n=1 Tax=Sphingomonas zeicaulis TaxID=1632740 RepID=UPI003D19F745